MENKNIFANARFAKRYLTRGGRVAVYIDNNIYNHVCVIEGENGKRAEMCYYNNEGLWSGSSNDDTRDIIKEYDEDWVGVL